MIRGVPGEAPAGRSSGAPGGRVAALDTLRAAVTVLVVLHHAVLAYCRFGHFDRTHYLWSTAPIVDADRWVGFDLIVSFNDGFFMPLMFLLSGLFVWPSLVRKGRAAYLRDRLLRLGVPLAASAVLLSPLAYYPSFRMTGAETGFGPFWAEMVSGGVFSGAWPSGPAWFIGVLLACDLGAVLAGRAIGVRGSGRAGLEGWPPGAVFGGLVLASAVAYLPLLAAFGPARWLSAGPLAVQASRMALYPVYFAAGVLLGRRGTGRGSLVPGGLLRRGWAVWAALAGALFLLLLGVQMARIERLSVLPAAAWLGLYGLTFVLFCAAANLAAIAGTLRFAAHPGAVWASLSRNAYGIYLLHYPVVVWLQYGLVGARLGAVLKAGLAFGGALLMGWGTTALMRRAPWVARVV